MILSFFVGFLIVGLWGPREPRRRWGALVLVTMLVVGVEIVRLYVGPVELGD